MKKLFVCFLIVIMSICSSLVYASNDMYDWGMISEIIPVSANGCSQTCPPHSFTVLISREEDLGRKCPNANCTASFFKVKMGCSKCLDEGNVTIEHTCSN